MQNPMAMDVEDPVLEVDGLNTHIFLKEGVARVVNGVSFQIARGGVLGLVGESGSGKTMTALSILGVVPFPGEVVSGEVKLNGRDILSISSEELRRIRGNEISIIFQDAVASLNPVLSIGSQMVEGITVHLDATKRDAEKMSLHLLEQVGLPDPERIMRGYPFQLSGGMAQRVMMAMAVALSPRVLIADEPTSNLDVTLQAELLYRLRTLRQEYETAILLITHDMGVVAGTADAVAVMYAGSLVEYSDTRTIFERPAHPYTWALLQAVPRLDSPYTTLRPLAGSPPDPMEMPAECPFLARCPKASNICRTSPMPPLMELEPGHKVACYNPVEPQH